VRRLIISLLLAGLAAVIAFCVKYAGPTPPPQFGPVWVVDHVAIKDDPVARKTIYTAYCARTETLSPAHLPADDELDPVSISENQLLRLRPGDACPGR
jgi:hypothetical protein